LKKKNLDCLDKKLIRILSKDGQISMGDMAMRLSVTMPTVRSRIKNLIEAGMLKIAGLINPDNHPELLTALVGLSIQSDGKLNEEVEKLANLDQVSWVAVVTGRYDVFAEVLVSGGMAELNNLLTHIIPKVGRVIRTETFIVMKSKNKWSCMPKGLENW